MMKGVRIGTVFGIPLRIDWSVIVIAWLFTWSLAASALPAASPHYGAAAYWCAAAVTALLLIASLAGHELSHSLTARRYGVHVRDITLWLLGGIATLESEATTPEADLRIALAGPGASVAIGAAAFTAGGVLAAAGAPALLIACAVWLGTINVILGIFNLAPAAPLDGGRVLRAWLWRRRGDRTSAAISAAHAGRVFGWILIGVGLAEFLAGIVVSGLWLIMLGWFVLTAAREEETQIRVKSELGGVRVSEIMTPDPVTAPTDASVDALIHDYVLARHCSTFPLVARDGTLWGLATLRRIRMVPPARRSTLRATDVAWPLAEVTTARPDELLTDVLQRTSRRGDGRILVLDGARLVGIISPTDVSRVLWLAEPHHGGVKAA